MRNPHRLLQHACVVLAALALPMLAPRAFHAAVATAPDSVEAPALSTVAEVDAVQVSAVMERRSLLSYTEPPAQTIAVARGDTLETLAVTFHSDAPTMRWANAITDVSQPAPGTTVLVPPAAGALVRVAHAARLSDLAAALGLDPRVLLDYNSFRDDQIIAQGLYVQVPRAIAPPNALDNSIVVPSSRGVPAVPSTQNAHGGNRYPYGQCTYYVASRRNVTWNGDAGTWFQNGRSAGRPVGHVPVAGAIVVFGTGWVGHVAYVEQVNANGSMLISEWNVRGWGVYDQRTVTNGTDVIGYVY